MASPIVSAALRTYFAALQREVEASYAIARAARARGFDPEIDVEIPLTQDLASRVERLLKEYDVEGGAPRSEQGTGGRSRGPRGPCDPHGGHPRCAARGPCRGEGQEEP